MMLTQSLLTFTLLAHVACSTGVKKMGTLPVCRSMDECNAHDGEQVQVIGVYTVWDPLPVRSKRQSPARQVVLMFDSEEGPFLGAWGQDNHFRALDEISRFGGRRVRVTGKFLSKMPPHPTDPPHAASVDGPCLHPVEAIDLDEQ